MSDTQILALRADGKNWTEIGDALGITRDKARRRWSALQAPAHDPINPTDREILRLERERDGVKEQLSAAQKKIKALNKNESIYQSLAQVIRETSEPLSVAPYNARSVSYLSPVDPCDRCGGTCFGVRHDCYPEKVGTACDAVLLLSDEHCDEVISREQTWGLENYSFDIFRCRLTRLRDMIRKYVSSYLPMHQFDRLWIFKLGDAVNGDIHGGGPRNHFHNTVKASLACGDAEAQFIQTLLPHFQGGIHVVGISGNHPRRTTKKDYDAPLDNFDYLVGTQIATRLDAEIRAGRVTVTLPDSYTAYAEVLGKLWCLSHGDDTTSYTGLPWTGFDRRNNRVQSLVTKVGHRVDYYAAGHYHTSAEFASAGGRSHHAGPWMAVDPYALNKLALGGGEPTQNFYVQDEEHGIILQIPMLLRDTEREAAYLRGEWEPDLGKSLVLETVAPKVIEGLQIVRSAA